jgi:flavocytochrome c
MRIQIGFIVAAALFALITFYMEQQQQKKIYIVGAGLAGLSAALEASANEFSQIVIIEKEAKFGGNSMKASSGINGVDTTGQRLLKIQDSLEDFENDTILSGGSYSDKELVSLLVKQSKTSVEWLESFGLPLNEVSICGGHSHARTHRQTDAMANIGSAIMKKIFEAVSSKKNIQILFNTKLKHLIKDQNGHVTGLSVETQGKSVDLVGNAVVLATGGFSCNHALIEEYAKQYSHLPTTNGDWTTGDGIFAAKEIGADIQHMSYVQIHPTGFLNPKEPTKKSVFLCPESMRGVGGILVNQTGKRFINELGTRDVVSEAILSNGKSYNGGHVSAFLLMNDEIEKSFGPIPFGFYKKFGLIQTYDNLKQFSEKEQIPLQDLLKTIEVYNAHHTGTKDEFGKVTFSTKFDAEKHFHVGIVVPSIHYTMGGIKFDKDSQVLDVHGKKIPGLFAAGEVTGGLHGKNRLAGNSLLECVVFGRIAGENANK